jgi:plastocyanin
MIRFGVLMLALFAALASAAAADNPVLQGHVGPAFTITLKDPAGADITHVDPGTYGLHVVSESPEHDFHLTGPGVDVVAGQGNTGTFDFQVALTDGTYKFFCDFHPGTMKGTFTVGTPPPPPPPAVVHVLSASVGPGPRIALARTARAGKARITVRDLSAKDNFHLTGPGVNKKTGVAFKGSVTWTVTLAAGTYSFRSDAHPKLHGTLKVSG